MKILVNKAHYPVTVLGHGKRVAVWLQGCSIHCPSCCSTDTWAFDEGRAIEVDSLVAWCRGVSTSGIDGVTISGGEPFEQHDALLALLDVLGKWRNKASQAFDVLVYSGFTENRLRRDFAQHLARIDAVVAGPYRKATAGVSPYRGSDNQRVLLLTPLGESRYGPEGLLRWKAGMQVAVDNEGMWMIGIPRAGDLARLEAGCREKGLALGMPSWRC